MKVIWAERYRPQSIEEFMGQDDIKAEITNVIAGNSPMQHFVFYSKEPGTGKTSMAYLLASQMGWQLHKFNASSKQQRGIEFVEEDLAPLSRSGQNEVIILLDEADQLTPAAQSALKGVIEDSTCFFILTCNDLSKVSPWLQSRCQVRTFQPLPDDQILSYMAQIAASESVEVVETALKQIVSRHSGDMRNCIGALQAYAFLPNAERERFINSISIPALDSAKFLKLCFKERDITEAYTLLKAAIPRQAVRQIFLFAVNGAASVENKLKVIDAAVQTERDLINGVDEQIALYNFVKLLV